MKYVFVEDLELGMVLGEDLMNEFNSIVYPKDHILDEKSIQSIRKLNYLMIKVDDKSNIGLVEKTESLQKNLILPNLVVTDVEEKRKRQLQSFKDSYLNTIYKFKDIIIKLEKGQKVMDKEIDNLINPLIRSVDSEKNVIDILKLMKADEEYLVTHSINVGVIAYLIGRSLGYSSVRAINLLLAGIFHDVGKKKVDKAIMNKKERLTFEEFLEVQKHSFYSCEVVKVNMDLDQEVIHGILDHHERIDGSGYPRGLSGKQINEFSKILAVADTYDAMTSKRVYADKLSPFYVLHDLSALSFKTLDPRICKLFIEIVTSNYVGQEVILNDGRKGKIVYLNKFDKFRPLVKIDDGFVDLFTNYSIEIQDFV